MVLTACGGERESLFEGEHELPPHWPTSLSDASLKIGTRLKQLEAQADVTNVDKELRELVEWIPEVAADHDLTEEQWLPIYELCEVMRQHLSDSSLGALEIAPDFQKLQQLLESAQSLLPSDVAHADVPAVEGSVPGVSP